MSVIIDGTRYDVKIVEDKMSADVIDKFAERTESGDLVHEVLGVYHNFELEFEPILDPVLHHQFYNDLIAPLPERTVTLPGSFTTFTFKCYIRVEATKIIRHKATGNTYEGLKVKFIAISPYRRGA